MKTFNKILIVIFFVIFLTSCKKREDSLVSIKGQILDYYTNEPITDINIELNEKESSFTAYKKELINNLQPNTDGKFEYSFLADFNWRISYELYSYSDKYEIINKKINKYEPFNSFNFKLKKLKIFALKIKNKTEKYSEFSTQLDGIGYTTSSKFKDTTIIFKRIVPDLNYYLRINLRECDTCETVSKNEEIYIENIDTTYLYREY